MAKRLTLSSTPIKGVNPTVKPSGTGCLDCLKLAADGKKGVWWLHLRRCAECGHIGCCDSSPNQHATAHFHETKHPVIQSFEEEDQGWFYNYVKGDNVDINVKLADPQFHPASQSVPYHVPAVAVVKKSRRKVA